MTIAAGSKSATLTVQTATDNVVEGNETFTAAISASNLPTGVTLDSGKKTVTVTITDADTATLGFDPATESVNEGSAATLTVKLTEEADSDVVFSWQTADGSAGSSDYTAQAATSVTIAAGSKSATLTVQTATDNVVEGNETFTATISASNLPTGVTLDSAKKTVTVTISDADTATLGFDPATESVNEGSKATFTVKLTEEADSDVVFSWQTADGSAGSGDYTAQAATSVTIAAGSKSATLTVQTATDNVVEGNETFTAAITASNLPTGVTLDSAKKTVTVTITDDDTATLGFDPATESVNEGSKAGTFTVKLTEEADSDVVFSWQTADGSAGSSDYTAQAATSVTIAAGEQVGDGDCDGDDH